MCTSNHVLTWGDCSQDSGEDGIEIDISLKLMHILFVNISDNSVKLTQIGSTEQLSFYKDGIIA